MSSELSFLVKQPKLIQGGHSYTINVTIQKQDISGISKFEVELPEGFVIRAVETSGASFIREQNIGKFIWVSLPNAESIEVAYQVYTPMNLEKEYKIYSTFFYLDGREKKSASYYSFMETEKDSEELTLLEINSLLIKHPDCNIHYSVQIGAFHDALEAASIQSYFNISDEIREDLDEGLVVYSVGDFPDYYKAKEYQENSSIEGAFLILYYMDMKISKDVALKILLRK